MDPGVLGPTSVDPSILQSLVEISSMKIVNKQNDDRPYLPVSVNGLKSTEFLVDSGSGKTIMDEILLPSNTQYSRLPTPYSFKAANGSKIEIKGYFSPTLNIGKRKYVWTVFIVSGLSGRTQAILGLYKQIRPWSL